MMPPPQTTILRSELAAAADMVERLRVTSAAPLPVKSQPSMRRKTSA